MTEQPKVSDEVAPFIYRNRADDARTIDELYFCRACGGYYGVPHTDSHCQQGRIAGSWVSQCACRFCRQATRQDILGSFGEFL